MANQNAHIDNLEQQIQSYILENFENDTLISKSIEIVSEQILNSTYSVRLPYWKTVGIFNWLTRKNITIMTLIIALLGILISIIQLTPGAEKINLIDQFPVATTQIETDSATKVKINTKADNSNNFLALSKKEQLPDVIKTQLLHTKRQKPAVLILSPDKVKHKKNEEQEIRYDVDPPKFGYKANEKEYLKRKDTFFFDKYCYELHRRIDNPRAITTYYSGTPFIDDLDDMVYFNYGEFYNSYFNKKVSYDPVRKRTYWKNDTLYKRAIFEALLPIAIRLYLTKDNVYFDSSWMVIKELPQKAIDIVLSPFYFRKYEVTNKEYRVFIEWVLASNGYGQNSYFGANNDTSITIWSNNTKRSKQQKTYNPIDSIIKHKQFFDAYRYRFFNQTLYKYDTINVFPKHDCWAKDFQFSYSDPMNRLYFQHPGYNDYPVNGVSYWQAMAFLDWKTHFHQKELDNNNTPYQIEYSLPSDIHWEMATLTKKEAEVIKLVYPKPRWFRSRTFYSYPNKSAYINTFLGDNNWITNLSLSADGLQNWSNIIKQICIEHDWFQGNYLMDGFFYTGIANLENVPKYDEYNFSELHLNELGISWLDGNVSEWMKEDYLMYKEILDPYLNNLQELGTKESLLLKSIIEYFDSFNDTDGKLVRGCNHADERYSRQFDKNAAGFNSKRFISPESQHSTVGFRYVITVKLKESLD